MYWLANKPHDCMRSKFIKNQKFMHRILFSFLTIVMSLVNIMCFSERDAQNEPARESYKEIAGVWKTYQIINDSTRIEQAVRKIEVNADGRLVQSVQFEIGPQCRLWLDLKDIIYDKGHLMIGGEFEGDMDASKQTIQVIYRSASGDKYSFLWERVNDRETMGFVEKIESSIDISPYNYQIPQETDDGLQCAALTSVGIDSAQIMQLINRIVNGKYDDIHSLLILKDEKLVLEEYFGAKGRVSGPLINSIYREKLHVLASAAKSIFSAVIGIAIEQGSIKDIHIPIYEVFPDYPALLDGSKKKISLYHALTMSTGFEWNELIVPLQSPGNDYNRMARSKDGNDYLFSKALIAEPGTQFSYNSAVSMILLQILTRKTGSTEADFARSYLFEPLGVTNFEWPSGGAPVLRPRDLLKFGLLFQNRGRWNARQIIPESWVYDSISPQQKTGDRWYGYQWWLKDYAVRGQKIHSYYAMGYAGIFLSVFPELNLIVVSTAQNFGNSWSRNYYEMIESYILPAILSNS